MAETGERKELFGIVEREGSKKSFWTRIGVAFANKDGSFNLRFDFVPVNPRTVIQMRDPRSPDETKEEAAA